MVLIFTRVGRVARVYMVTKNSSNSFQAKRSVEIRGLASIVWIGGVARIFRLENEGNVTSVAKEIIVLIESKLECVVRTGILSGVPWVGSLGRIKGNKQNISGINIYNGRKSRKCIYGNKK